jgi:hypothetical protein
MEEIKGQELDVKIVDEFGTATEEEVFETFDSDEFKKHDYSVSGKEEFIDVEKGVVVDKDSLSHWEKIKHLAKQLNVEILDPDKSCKHCNGLGYDGIDKATNTPIPCECIFKEKSKAAAFVNNSLAKPNRAMRRKQEQNMSAMKRAIINANQKKRWKKEPTNAMVAKKNRKKMVEKVRKINRSKKK